MAKNECKPYDSLVKNDVHFVVLSVEVAPYFWVTLYE